MAMADKHRLVVGWQQFREYEKKGCGGQNAECEWVVSPYGMWMRLTANCRVLEQPEKDLDGLFLSFRPATVGR